MRSWHLMALVVALVTASALVSVAQAQSEVTINGRVVNGTQGGPVPAGINVALHSVGPSGVPATTTVRSDAEGRFAFSIPVPQRGTTYAVAANFQGVPYNISLELPLGPQPVELTVFEATNDPADLRVSSAVLLVKPFDTGARMLAGSEVVRLVNTGDRTFVPDLSQTAMGLMRFLRFSLPPGVASLQASSDMPGGEVVNVGAGFAMTSPVTPGEHLLDFSYLFPYQGDSLTFTRTYHLDTGALRVLVADTLGELQAPGLVPAEPVRLGDTIYRAWGATGKTAGTKAELRLAGLPQPSLGARFGDALLHGSPARTAVVSLLGLALASVLAYSIFLGWTGKARLWYSGDALMTEQESQAVILAELADLDEAFQQGEVPAQEYHQRREGLKARLLAPSRGRPAV